MNEIVDRDPAEIDFLGLVAAKVAGGRPPIYKLETAIQIIQRISEGETLTSICQDAEMPHRAIVYWWMERVPSFGDAFVQARIKSAGLLVEEAMTAARSASDKDSSMAARVKSDTFLRVAAMIDPSRWSEKRGQMSGVTISINTNLGGSADQSRRPGEYVIDVPESE